MTDHYLNPVVPQNYSNTGTLGDFSANYQRDLTPKDRLSFIVRHEVSRYDIPNEHAYSKPRASDKTRTTSRRWESPPTSTLFPLMRWQIFAAMVRDNANGFNSNANSTPIEVFQHNWFREGYFKGSVTIDHGRHECKAGVESDNTFLNENFSYIVDRSDSIRSWHALAFQFRGVLARTSSNPRLCRI